MTSGTAGGRTEIAGRVLERIAVQAVAEVDQARGVARRLGGVPLPARASRRRPGGQQAASPAPQVRAQVNGHIATLQMTVSVVYPAPVRQVTRRLRAHVIARVGLLTGLDLRQVDIDVARLVGPEPTRRVVQ